MRNQHARKGKVRNVGPHNYSVEKQRKRMSKFKVGDKVKITRIDKPGVVLVVDTSYNPPIYQVQYMGFGKVQTQAPWGEDSLESVE